VVFRRTAVEAAQRIELAQVINQLCEELQTAQRAGEGEDLRFELGPVELELTVAVDRQGGPEAKVRFWVIELGSLGQGCLAGDPADQVDPRSTRVRTGRPRTDSGR
jgi:Trypsin-co-occurring domain 2